MKFGQYFDFDFTGILEDVDLEQVRLGCSFHGQDEVVYSDIILDKDIFNFNIKNLILSPENQPTISRPSQYSLAIFLKGGTFKKGAHSPKIQVFDAASNGSLILESNTLDKEASNSSVLKFILKVDESVFKYNKGYVTLNIALNTETEIETNFPLPIEINRSNSFKPTKRKSQDCDSNAEDLPEAKVSRSENVEVENLFQMNLDHMQPLAEDLADPLLVHEELKRKVKENEELKRKVKDLEEEKEILRSRLASRSIDQVQFVLSLPEPMKKIKGFHCLEYFFKALGWKSGKDVEHFKSTHSHESEAKYQCESIVASDLSADIKLQTSKCSTISVSELRFENGILKEQLSDLQDEVKQMKCLMDENSPGANDGNHDHPYLVEVSFF